MTVLSRIRWHKLAGPVIVFGFWAFVLAYWP